MKLISKILLVFVVCFAFAFCLCACKKELKPFIVFSNQPITSKTVPQKSFKAGTKVYYGAINPKGFECRVIKVQIFKKDEKSEFWGYSYYSNKEYRLKNQQYFLDYFVIHNPGHYIIQVFEITNLNKPVILGDFWIGEK